MDSRALIDWADKAARLRPGVLVDDSFGADWHAYKVGGRVFMLASTAPGNDVRVIVWKVRDKVFLIVTDDDSDQQIVTVKIDPHHGDVLSRDHDTITPGHYLDKRHWLTIGPGTAITEQLIETLVRTSYDLAEGHHLEQS